MAGQLVPDAGTRYRDDKAALEAALRARKPDLAWYSRSFNPYPWALQPAEAAELERLLHAIRRGICAVVEHYFRDPRLRTLLALAPAVESLLRVAALRPYRPGAFRPDFLHDVHGAVRVSEINARFPLNGFLVSHLLDAAAGETFAEDRPGFRFNRLPALAEIPRALRAALGDTEPVMVVKGQERGWDIRLLMALWPSLREVAPSDFRARSDAFAILELHQHELLESLPGSALRRLAEEGRCLNDLRTIFLGHDKRLLAVFTSELLRDYLPADEVEYLHRHVIPTFVLGLGGEPLRAALEHPGRWVLKPNLLGKGEGIVLGRNVSTEAWRAALEQAPADYVLQPYVEQRLYEILTEVDGAVRPVPMKVVGLLPALNEQFLGPGIYRASQADIVNVAGGGTILAPVIAAPTLATEV